MPRKRSVSEAAGADAATKRTRLNNWDDRKDEILLGILKEQQLLGNGVAGHFPHEIWPTIVEAFNHKTDLSYHRENLKNRLKVLKTTYSLYHTIVNKSGWEWDPVRNIPTPGSPSKWNEIIAVNPNYAKCKDKPFPRYRDIDFLCGKKIDGDSSEHSMAEADDLGDMHVSWCNLNSTTKSKNAEAPPNQYEANSTLPKQQTMPNPSPNPTPEDRPNPNPEDRPNPTPEDRPNPSPNPTPEDRPNSSPNPTPEDRPNPTPEDRPNPSPNPTPEDRPNSSPNPTPEDSEAFSEEQLSSFSSEQHITFAVPLSCRKRPRHECAVLAKLVDIERQRLEIAREYLNRAIAARQNVYSIEDCMKKLEKVEGISPETFVVACEGFKDQDSRAIFMNLDGPYLAAWIDHQMRIDHQMMRQVQMRQQFQQQQQFVSSSGGPFPGSIPSPNPQQTPISEKNASGLVATPLTA